MITCTFQMLHLNSIHAITRRLSAVIRLLPERLHVNVALLLFCIYALLDALGGHDHLVPCRVLSSGLVIALTLRADPKATLRRYFPLTAAQDACTGLGASLISPAKMAQLDEATQALLFRLGKEVQCPVW